MPWPRQACVSRTYLPEVVPPALVSPKWGAHGGQGGHAGEERLLGNTQGSGHLAPHFYFPPPPQQMSFRGNHTARAALERKGNCRFSPLHAGWAWP